MRFTNKQEKIQFHIVDILMFYIYTTSLSAIFFLCIEKYSPLIPLVTGAVLTFMLFFISKIFVSLRDSRLNVKILLILLSAFLIRTKPYNYIIGGQDQGLYLSMSKQFDINKSFYLIDHFRETLTEYQKNIYDKNNSYQVSGLNTLEISTSKFIFSFYPLHPIWLSIFGKIFGDNSRVYSLTFFSTLSILGFYLLANEISNNKISRYIVALFLLLNPLHLFISKFPVTENVALLFSVFTFYYLLKGYKSMNRQKSLFYYFFSILSANCFYYTRMSFFMYIPYLLFLIIIVSLMSKTKFKKKEIYLYSLTILISFIFSWYIYKLKSPILFEAVAGGIWQIFINNWILTIIIGLFYCFIILLISTEHKLSNFFIKTITNPKTIKKLLTITIIALILSTLYLLYLFAFTDKYDGTLYEHYYRDNDITLFRFMPIYTIFQYISPIGIYIVVKSIVSSRFIKLKGIHILLLVFSMLFTFYIIFFSKFNLYHFYYVRYYASEVIPYSLLFISMAIPLIYKKNIWYIPTLLIFIYFGIFSYFQIGKIEGSDNRFFYKIDKQLSDKDVLFIETQNIPITNEIITPLKYFLNINTFNVPTIDTIFSESLLKINDNSTKYLLSYNKHDNQDIKLIEEILYSQNYFTNGDKHLYSFLPIMNKEKCLVKDPILKYMIPINNCETGLNFYLYKFI